MDGLDYSNPKTIQVDITQLQQAAFLPNKPVWEPARQELRSSKNGDIIAQARHSGEVISQLKDDEPIRQALRYAMMLVGIRAQNIPQKEEKDVLIEFVQRNYGGHSSLEIKIAFDLAVNGTLEIEDVKAYENFSCEYLGRIMSAYRKYAAIEYKHSKIPEIMNGEPQKQIEFPDHVDWSDHWIKIVESAKNGEIQDKAIPTPVYDWLQRTGLIDEKIYNKEEKWNILKSCKDQYRDTTGDELLNPRSTSDKPNVLKYRFYMLNDQDIIENGEIKKKAAWRNDPEIMSQLAVMSKQAIIRELAILEAAKDNS